MSQKGHTSQSRGANGAERTAKFARRDYLKTLTALSGVSIMGASGASGTATAASQGRIDDAVASRNDATTELVDTFDNHTDKTRGVVQASTNGNVINKYSKALNTSTSNGWDLTQTEWNDFHTALDNDDWAAIDVGGARKLVSPSTKNKISTEGLEAALTTTPLPPEYTSLETAAEVAHCYWMAALRDEEFGTFEDHPDYDSGGTYSYVEDVDYIRNQGVDPAWLTKDQPFRGTFPGSEKGPYLSQVLLQSARMGNVPIEPKVHPLPDQDYNTDFGTLGNIMLGTRGGSAEPYGEAHGGTADGTTSEYISTPRHLAGLVRRNPSFQFYLRAALQLLDWGVPPRDSLPVGADGVYGTLLQYNQFGGAGIIDLVARAAGNALDAAWYHKWNHLRPRPEKYAANTIDDDYAELPDLLEPGAPGNGLSVLKRQQDSGDYNGLALPQAYHEGSPAHPAYPSGHSVVAGACITVLKAFFEDATLENLIPYPDQGNQETNPNGGEPQAYSGSDELTVWGELNKLGDNIGVGRIMAGVHYWSDHIYGFHLGEQVAFGTLNHMFTHQRGGTLEDEWRGHLNVETAADAFRSTHIDGTYQSAAGFKYLVSSYAPQ